MLVVVLRPRESRCLTIRLTKACCEMSRRDGAIVAWHEVPGDSATPKEPSRRVRCDSRRFAHRFNDWSDEISNAKTENIYVV